MEFYIVKKLLFKFSRAYLLGGVCWTVCSVLNSSTFSSRDFRRLKLLPIFLTVRLELKHLQHVAGLASLTCQRYVTEARKFLHFHLRKARRRVSGALAGDTDVAQ